MPSTQWTTLTVFLRTTWTKVKQAKKSDMGPPDIGCSNCGEEPETTTHLMYHCSLATSIWELIFTMINRQMREVKNTHQDIIPSIDKVLFHYLPEIPKDYRTFIIEIIMTVKHILYKLKFREDFVRYPSHRRVALLIIIDIEKVITCRKLSAQPYTFLFDYQNLIRDNIGMGIIEDI